MSSAAKKLFDKSVADDTYMNADGFLLSNPYVASDARCQRRWVDWQRLALDCNNSALYMGKDAPFTRVEMQKLLRERFLLYAACVESKPGQEPQNPFLYAKYS